MSLAGISRLCIRRSILNLIISTPPCRFASVYSNKIAASISLDTPDFTSLSPSEVNITVPVKLEKRLTKRVAHLNSKSYEKEQRLARARGGSKAQPVIVAKKAELNFYKGQTYGKRQEVLLVSKGWRSRKSVGDHFTILPSTDEDSHFNVEGKDSFEALGIRKALEDALKEQGIERPSISQIISIPEVLAGGHNILAAETGCGKTLSYLLPVLEQIAAASKGRLKRKPNQPYAIVILPTRELVEQVFQVALKLSKSVGVYVRKLQGGNLESKLHSPPTKDVDILISSISILSAMSSMEVLDIRKVSHIVLDEADTLLDDSFNDEVVRFLRRFPLAPNSQNLRPVQLTLVSATMPRSVDEILSELVPAETLNRLSTPGLHRLAKSVPQEFRRVRKMDKPQLIIDIAHQAIEKQEPLMIFTNKGNTSKWLEAHLARNAADCAALHGDLSASQRRERFASFVRGEVFVLICTDIGSRGVDTTTVKHVVNYEFPCYLADYIHRSGRVGRLGSPTGCKVTNFISGPLEAEVVQQIEMSIRKDQSLSKVNANVKRLLNAKYGMNQQIDAIPPTENARR